jgi:hypothetical protein
VLNAYLLVLASMGALFESLRAADAFALGRSL